MNEEISLNEYCNRNIERCAAHLEYIREIIDVSDGLNEISEEIIEVKILTEFEQAINFNSLITIADLESTIILKSLENSSLEAEKKYFLKLAYLIIFETFNSFDNYREELKIISLRNEKLTQDFKEINIKVKDFRNKHDFNKTIYQIRNKTIGHIDKDFKLYHSIVSNIEIKSSLKMFGEFIRILNEVFEFSTNVLSQSDGTDMSGINVEEKYDELKNKIKEYRDTKE